jgi:hypothetical protein
MKFKKRVEVRIEETESRADCDFCGRDMDHDRGGFDRNEVTIRAEEGEVYPECDCREVEEVDCCLTCWKEKVKPALQALGAKFHTFAMDNGRLPTMPFDPDQEKR